MTNKKVRAQSQLRFSSFTALTLIVLVIGVFVIAPTLNTFFEQQRELSELRMKTAAAENQVEELTKERSRWSDPSYVRSQAKERLYYVLPGERSFLVVNDLDQPLDEVPEDVSDQITETKIDWASQLAASFLIAGLSDEAPENLITPKIGK